MAAREEEDKGSQLFYFLYIPPLNCTFLELRVKTVNSTFIFLQKILRYRI